MTVPRPSTSTCTVEPSRRKIPWIPPTPAGVGGVQGIFLRDGSTVQVEVEGLGTVTNPIRAKG